MNGAMKSDATNMEIPSHHRNTIIFVWEKWEKSKKKKIWEKRMNWNTYTGNNKPINNNNNNSYSRKKSKPNGIRHLETWYKTSTSSKVFGSRKLSSRWIRCNFSFKSLFLVCIWLRFFFALVLLRSKYTYIFVVCVLHCIHHITLSFTKSVGLCSLTHSLRYPLRWKLNAKCLLL